MHVGQFGARYAAIERQAGPRQVERVIRRRARSRPNWRGSAAARPSRPASAAKRAALARRSSRYPRRRRRGGSSACRSRARRAGRRAPRRRHAEPVHAGIDHHVARAAARRPPARDLRRGVEHRARDAAAARAPCPRRARRAAPTRGSPSGASASASAQVATKKSRHPAAASRRRDLAPRRARSRRPSPPRRTPPRPLIRAERAPVGDERVAVEAQAQGGGHARRLASRARHGASPRSRVPACFRAARTASRPAPSRPPPSCTTARHRDRRSCATIILADERQEAAEIAGADMIGDRHRAVADARREHLRQQRRDRAVGDPRQRAHRQDREQDQRRCCPASARPCRACTRAPRAPRRARRRWGRSTGSPPIVTTVAGRRAPWYRRRPSWRNSRAAGRIRRSAWPRTGL